MAHAPVPATPSDGWRTLLAPVAGWLSAEIGPRSVAVVSPDRSPLVDVLRGHGIAAVAAAHGGQLEGRYDLVLWLDEGLEGSDVETLAAGVARSTDDVLIARLGRAGAAAGPPASAWIARFARLGFRLDVDFDARLLGPGALRFRKAGDESRTLDDLLRERDLLRDDVDALRDGATEKERHIHRLNQRLADLNSRLAAAIAHLADAQARLAESLARVADRTRRVEQLDAEIAAIKGTLGWRVLARLRVLRDRVVPPGSRRDRAYRGARRVAATIVDRRARAAAGGETVGTAAGEVVAVRTPGRPPTETTAGDAGAARSTAYARWLEAHAPTTEALGAMADLAGRFAVRPRVSIVTPVYDPDEIWLRRAIESVQRQVYPEWELCLVDDASTRPHVRKVLEEYAEADPRIRVRTLSANLGIAGASNEGLGMASGDFVGFLDHDDELAPDALFEVVKRLNEQPDLDLVYTDEDKLGLDGRRLEPTFKPDWSPDLLLSTNYLCHLVVARRRLLEEAGGFRPGFDGSQDHDLLLRVTERTDRVAHIPKVLYHWRKVGTSAASGLPDAKPYAWSAGRRAVEDALGRRGRPGRVEMAYRGFYTTRYAVTGVPLVSILVATRSAEALERCVRAVERRTDYDRHEIVAVDRGGRARESQDYLAALALRWPVYAADGAVAPAAARNFAASRARGEYLLFLDDDVEAIRSDWVREMLGHAQRPGVGTVGPKLLDPIGRIDHAGIVVGLGGVAGYPFRGVPATVLSPFGLADVARNVSAVTGAAMLVPRRVFEEVAGFDEAFRTALSDVDFCLRVRERGHLVVYAPTAVLRRHDEGGGDASRDVEADAERFRARWTALMARGDPYYNPNLSRERADWSVRDPGERPAGARA
jgi:GT2 family glycosyltransferase